VSIFAAAARRRPGDATLDDFPDRDQPGWQDREPL